VSDSPSFFMYRPTKPGKIQVSRCNYFQLHLTKLCEYTKSHTPSRDSSHANQQCSVNNFCIARLLLKNWMIVEWSLKSH
jgi:hypothetical protein